MRRQKKTINGGKTTPSYSNVFCLFCPGLLRRDTEQGYPVDDGDCVTMSPSHHRVNICDTRCAVWEKY